jgi:hypothetical protein
MLSRRRLLVSALAGLLSLAGVARAAAPKTLLRRFRVTPFTVPRTRAATRVALAIAPARRRIAAVTVSERELLVLRLGGLRAARPPEVVWRVYLAPPGVAPSARTRFFVGAVALHGAGIGSSPRAGVVELIADTAVRRALRTATDTLHLVFVPSGPIRNGRPTTPRPAAALRVGEVSLWVKSL